MAWDHVKSNFSEVRSAIYMNALLQGAVHVLLRLKNSIRIVMMWTVLVTYVSNGLFLLVQDSAQVNYLVRVPSYNQ